MDDGSKVVIGNDNIAGFLGYCGAAAHGKAHICQLERRRIIDAVAGHTRNQS